MELREVLELISQLSMGLLTVMVLAYGIFKGVISFSLKIKSKEENIEEEK